MDTKQFGAVTLALKALDPDDDAGQFEAVLSAPTLDRDKEIIDPGAFEPLPEHITIDVDHGMSTRATVGSGTPFYDGDLLKFRGTFSTLPQAQDVRTLVTEGHVRHMSVAFMNAARTEDDETGVVHIIKAELLNAAIVPIPSNREAAILSAKSAEAAALSLAACPKCAAEQSSDTVQHGKAAASAPADPGGQAAAPAPAETSPTGAVMKTAAQIAVAIASARAASLDARPSRSPKGTL